MKKNYLKNILGFTLIEILIGVVISSIMMAAMYTTYSVVNRSYSQVTDRAKISRSGRDIVEMMMRDIRMAGFKYRLGTNTLDFPNTSYLQFNGGDTTIALSHDPIIIEKDVSLGFAISGAGDPTPKHNDDDKCCDRIHIVYDDFNQNDTTQPYKRYKTTYYAEPTCTKFEEVTPADPADATATATTPQCLDGTYSIYKAFESWIQVLGVDTGEWSSDCNECYVKQKVRDHVVDMEFIPFDIEGRKINPLEATPENELEANRQKIYDIRVVDVRLTFRSKKEFFRTDKPRPVKGISNRIDTRIPDKYLRDSVVVTIHTRNIGDGI